MTSNIFTLSHTSYDGIAIIHQLKNQLGYSASSIHPLSFLKPMRKFKHWQASLDAFYPVS